MSKINCNFCSKKFGIKAIEGHLSTCIPNFVNEKSGYLIEFISIGGVINKSYQMFAIFGNKCRFNHIDKFLRRMWCECCNHMSTIDVIEEVNENETHTNVKFNTLISKYEHANQFIYCYDMGSITNIYFRIIKKLEGINKNTDIELLYRNEPFKIKCDNFKKCKGVAMYVFEQELFCDTCKNNIDKENQEYVLKISNSPRSGICAYGE